MWISELGQINNGSNDGTLPIQFQIITWINADLSSLKSPCLIFQWYFGLGLNLICVFVGTRNLEIQWVLYPLAFTELFGFYSRCLAPHWNTYGHWRTEGHRIGSGIICTIQTWKQNRVRKTPGGYIIMTTTNICLIINFVCSRICCLQASCLKVFSYLIHYVSRFHTRISQSFDWFKQAVFAYMQSELCLNIDTSACLYVETIVVSSFFTDNKYFIHADLW